MPAIFHKFCYLFNDKWQPFRPSSYHSYSYKTQNTLSNCHFVNRTHSCWHTILSTVCLSLRLALTEQPINVQSHFSLYTHTLCMCRTWHTIALKAARRWQNPNVSTYFSVFSFFFRLRFAVVRFSFSFSVILYSFALAVMRLAHLWIMSHEYEIHTHVHMHAVHTHIYIYNI